MNDFRYSDTVHKDAGDGLDKITRAIMQRDGLKYSEAIRVAAKENPALFQAYYSGVRTTTKSYGQLSASQQAMIRAQADRDWTRSQALSVLDHHAKLMAGSHVRGTGQVSPESYRAALLELERQFPSLARAADDGFISAQDWKLLATLQPSLAAEIEREHGVLPLNLRGLNYSGSRRVRRYSSDSHIHRDANGNEFRSY